MAAGLAHEIRNPLVSIRTFTQLLPERMGDEEFRSKFFELTLSEVDRICALINELLAFARPAPAQLSRMNLNSCLEGICLLLDSQARNRGVRLRMQLRQGLRSIIADEDQVKQVVMNVVLNAIQACSDGGDVEIASYETAVADKGYLCIEIADTGRGIERELLEHIFDPFFTTRRDGTGLGLAIAHQIVSTHGGFIDVKSEPGQGTTFLIHLPFNPPPMPVTQSAIFHADDLRLSG
jgi:signal transduction histidine kinase